VGVTYFYKVRAIASSSSYNGIYSAAKSCLAVCAQPEVTLKIASATGKPVLSWDAVDGAEHYAVYRSVNDSEYEPLPAQTDTSYTEENAAVDSQYSYKVIAVAADETLNSTEAVTESIIAVCAKPKASIALNGKKPMVSWEAVDGAVAYKVYRSTKSGSGYKVIGTVEDISYTDSSAKKGTTYYYKIKAVSEGGNTGAYSSYVKIKSK